MQIIWYILLWRTYLLNVSASFLSFLRALKRRLPDFLLLIRPVWFLRLHNRVFLFFVWFLLSVWVVSCNSRRFLLGQLVIHRAHILSFFVCIVFSFFRIFWIFCIICIHRLKKNRNFLLGVSCGIERKVFTLLLEWIVEFFRIFTLGISLTPRLF